MPQPHSTHLYILHGWTYNANTAEKWQPFREALAQHQIASTFLELPGLLHPLTQAWDIEHYIEWLAQTLPAGPVILVGHSFGGQLATHFAARFPERVNCLVLIASSGVRDQRLKTYIKRLIFGSAARTARLLGLKSAQLEANSIVKFLRQVLYKAAQEKDYLEATAVQQQTMALVLEASVQPVVWLIRCPTLLLWGSDDTVTPVRTLSIFKHIPDHTVTILAGARHSPQYTHPEEAAQAVASFCTKHLKRQT